MKGRSCSLKGCQSRFKSLEPKCAAELFTWKETRLEYAEEPAGGGQTGEVVDQSTAEASYTPEDHAIARMSEMDHPCGWWEETTYMVGIYLLGLNFLSNTLLAGSKTE